MESIKHIILIIFSSLTLISWGQDPHFSNFTNNQLYYNPAYAGIDYGMKLKLAYRRQWPGIPSKFQTINACFDQSVRIARGLGGYGLVFTSNTEGEGSLQNTSIGIPIAARIPVAEKSMIQIGAMPVLVSSSIDWDRFIFSGQLNPYYGNIYPSKFIPPDAATSKKNFVDIFNVGGVFKYEKTSLQANSEKFYRRFEIGFAGFHLSQPNQSFTNSAAPLYAKYVFMTNYVTSVSLNSSGLVLIEPSFMCEKQWHMFSYMAGINTSYVHSKIDFGLWWRSNSIDIRNTNAVVLLLGYRFSINDYTFLTASLSYDVTVSKLMDATKGSPEITINLRFNRIAFLNDKPDACDEDVKLGIK